MIELRFLINPCPDSLDELELELELELDDDELVENDHASHSESDHNHWLVHPHFLSSHLPTHEIHISQLELSSEIPNPH